MVSLVHETIKFIQLETKNPGKTAYIEKEKTHYNSMSQILLYILGNEQNSSISTQQNRFINPQERTDSYRLRTRYFAGDMEVDGIFIQDNVRNTITIISHLGEERRETHFKVFLSPSFSISLCTIKKLLQFLKSSAISSSKTSTSTFNV